MRTAVPLLALWLSACGGLLPVAGPPPNLYNLTPKSTFGPTVPAVDWQLVIEEPLAAGGLDSSQIALRPNSTELKYFAGTRWTERAPKMIQTLLVESFENSGKIVAVGRQAIGLRSDLSLKTELREFQAEYFGATKAGAARVRVRINAKLIRQPRQIILASRSFESVIEAADTVDDPMRPIISAFDDALGKVLKSIVEWTLTTGDEALRQHGSAGPDGAPGKLSGPAAPADVQLARPLPAAGRMPGPNSSGRLTRSASRDATG